MSDRPWVCFVVPCFNEEDNVGPTVDSIRAAASGKRPFEIVLVDDCSTDGTLARMQALAAADPRIRVVHNPVNLSLGGAYKRGVAVAEADYVIVIPVVTNSAVRTWYRAMASRGFTTLLNWLFWLDVGYYNGAVLHQTARLHTIENRTNSFAYQT